MAKEGVYLHDVSMTEGQTMTTTYHTKTLTDLMRAAANGRVNVVRELIDKGADINERGPRESTALLFAVGSGHLEVVKELVEHGARVEVKEAAGWTPIRLAKEDGYKEIADYLESKVSH